MFVFICFKFKYINRAYNLGREGGLNEIYLIDNSLPESLVYYINK